MAYQCQECGFESEKPGKCPSCKVAMVEICDSCGMPEAECACQ